MLLSGPNTGEHEKNMTVLEQTRKESEPIFPHRPGKEPVIRDMDDPISPSTRKQGCPQLQREHVVIVSDGDLDERIEGRQSRHRFRGRSPNTRYSREVNLFEPTQ